MFRQKTYSILKNVPLKTLNAFGVETFADKYIQLFSLEAFEDNLIKEKLSEAIIILGGGTNTLFVGNCPIPIVSIGIRDFVFFDRDGVCEVTVGAGVIWDEFVLWAVSRGYYGVENLGGIPGWCGAAPVQNIGAYGAQLSDTIISALVYDIQTHSIKTIANSEMDFSYRNSIFKKKPDKLLILQITLKLDKYGQVNASYPDVVKYIEKNDLDVKKLKPIDMYKIIKKIRSTKLPNPSLLPNCGSFFKNPIVDSNQLSELLNKHPDIPFFEVGKERYKIPAAYIIEKRGWKGKILNGVGVSPNHALVLVNFSDTTGENILKLASLIRRDIYETYGITLEPEVNIIVNGERFNLA